MEMFITLLVDWVLPSQVSRIPQDEDLLLWWKVAAHVLKNMEAFGGGEVAGGVSFAAPRRQVTFS